MTTSTFGYTPASHPLGGMDTTTATTMSITGREETGWISAGSHKALTGFGTPNLRSTPPGGLRRRSHLKTSQPLSVLSTTNPALLKKTGRNFKIRLLTPVKKFTRSLKMSSNQPLEMMKKEVFIISLCVCTTILPLTVKSLHMRVYENADTTL